jgi:hypothetical protein
MTERLHNPEQPREGREYEVQQLVDLNELIQEMYDVGRGNRPGRVSDVAMDVLTDLAHAMTRRDPELGRLLVDKLIERAVERQGVAPSETYRHDELAQSIYREVLLPQKEAQAAPPPEAPGQPPAPPAV